MSCRKIIKVHTDFDEESNSLYKDCDVSPLSLSTSCESPALIVCKYEGCHKTFKCKQSYKYHIKMHKGEEDYICDVPSCQKKFTKLYSYQVHMRTHTGEKPFKCPFESCNASFSQQQNLKRHEQMHMEIKPYICNKCNKTFITLQNMQQHNLTHENNYNREVFRCNIGNCTRKYMNKRTLVTHQKEKHCNNEQQEQYSSTNEHSIQDYTENNETIQKINTNLFNCKLEENNGTQVYYEKQNEEEKKQDESSYLQENNGYQTLTLQSQNFETKQQQCCFQIKQVDNLQQQNYVINNLMLSQASIKNSKYSVYLIEI